MDTYKVLSERYAKEPDNVEVLYKYADKLNFRYSSDEKIKELYEKILALDPKGEQGTMTLDSPEVTVSYTEAAEFALGRMAAFGRKPDPAPMLAYIENHPDSKLLKEGYGYLAFYYQQYASKEDATAFFEKYTSQFPDDRSALGSYVERIIRDKGPVDRGLELAEKLKTLTGYPRNPEYQQHLANLFILKGEPDKASDEYGKDFADDYVTTTVYALFDYANFWLQQKTNLESVEAIADVAVRINPDVPYFRQRAATIYAGLDKTEKALATYGPELAEQNWGDQGVLAGYAGFWNRQGKNLESAAEAAKRAVELASDYYNNFILGQVLFKLGRNEEALKAAEKSLEFAQVMAKKHEGFPTQQYENLIKQIKEAMVKKSTG